MTNSKTTKRALLSSTLALLMCVVMLIGTTFAWFTDTASTAVNKIQAGTLDVGLEMWDGEKWVNAEGETLNFKTADNRTDILWEPGCTYELPMLRVVNNGNLALRYKVIITGIDGDAKLNEAIEWKAVFPVDEALWGATDARELVYDLDYWYDVNDGEGPDPSNPTRLLAKDTVDAFGVAADVSEFTIRGHMKETAGNEYQGLSIDGIAITVCATQMYYEEDSYDDQYDKDATYPEISFVSNTEDLTNAFAESGTVMFTKDIVNTTIVPNQDDVANTVQNGQNLTVDLAGKTFTSTIKIFKVENGATLTIKSSVPGGKIYVDNNIGGNRFAVIVEEGGTLNIEDGVTIEMKAFDTTPNAGAICNSGTVNMNGGKILVYDTAAVMNMSGTFNMNGGEISLNTVDGAELGYQAYGLTCSSAVINLNAGSITGTGYAIETFDFGSTATVVNTAAGFSNTAVEP